MHTELTQGGGLSSEGPSDGSVSTEETGADRPAAPIPDDVMRRIRDSDASLSFSDDGKVYSKSGRACQAIYMEAIFDRRRLLAEIDHLGRAEVLISGELTLALEQYREANEECRRLKGNAERLLNAASAVMDAVDSNHENKGPPHKYTVPWHEIVALRQAVLIAKGAKEPSKEEMLSWLRS